jgi:site-specific recombinase XerD
MHPTVKRNTFSIHTFINRGKTNKNSEHPIYCRVTVQGKSREFSTQIWVANNKWSPAASKVSGSNESSKTANHSLNAIRNNLMNIRADLQEQGKLITAEIVVNIHLGKVEKKRTLIQIHEYHNEQHVKKLIGKGYAPGTYGRYKSSLEHVKAFLKCKYNIDDILLNDLSYSFATEYEFYLKTKNEACCHNTAVKYIKNLKAVINFAVSQEWLKFNPLDRYKGKLERVEKDYLTQEELNTIANKNFNSKRIEEVRDIFVFCCYTGLAYSDVLKITNEHIVLGINGKKQINIRRTKTDTIVKVPLLEPATEIIAKYKDHPNCQYSGHLLPVKSNQKHNEYLKEIAEVCGCNKNLTTHIARHTFATLMLTLGISMESVSSMLGHTDIKTTQIYGKIIAQKVIKEMDGIDNLFNIDKKAQSSS